MRIIHLDSTGSTNQEARKLAEQADFGPLWIRADQQSSGRGRTGREWVSPSGNLYASHLFPTDQPLNALGQYSFVAALAVYDCLRSVYPKGDFGLKWPNDALLNREKISGLLLETGKTHHQSWVIVGVGINLVSHPKLAAYPATSLAVHIDDTPLTKMVLSKLVETFDHWRKRYEREGFAPIKDAWLAGAVNVPGPVRVRLPSEEFEGEAMGLSDIGALQVRLPNGTIRDVHAGDVYLG